MVQRKVTNKLGIQSDQIKTNELFVNLIKTSSPSFQHHDSRKIIVGADSKKKMKKSRPTKRSDQQIERLSSANRGIMHVPQPGKPPPGRPVASSSSPQKKSAGRQPYSDDAMPNYMKPTSCSDARKEQIHQVSSKNLQALLSDGEIFTSSSKKWKNRAKMNSSSVLTKEARMLVRSLTKTTSFKPVRASSVVKKRRCPGVSENLNAQRATCSSTLKDSKFPAYLELNSGGTKSEGKSVIKVCPYTYCSLNGHHHPPMPPLTGFLASRRRMLKAQRGVKLGYCTSPRVAKQKEVPAEQIKLDEPSTDEEKQEDFFVQIYSKEREGGTAVITELVNNVKPMVDEKIDDHDTKAAEPYDQQVLEILSDEFPFSDVVSSQDSNEQWSAISAKMEAPKYRTEVSTEEKREENSVLQIGQESSMGTLSWSHDEIGGRQIIPIDRKDFEFSDADCEADNNTIAVQNTQYLDLHEVPIQFGSCIFPGNWVLEVDEAMIRFLKDIQNGSLLQQSFEDEKFDGESISSKADSDQNFEIQCYTQGPESQTNSEMQDSIVEKDGLSKDRGKTFVIPLEKHLQELSSTDWNVDRKCLQVNNKILNTIETESYTSIAYVKDMIVPDNDEAEEIWDVESQDFRDIIYESSKAGSNAPSDGEDEEAGQAGVDESYMDENCTSLLDDFEDTGKHLKPLNERSNETLAGEETSMISMSTDNTSNALDSSQSDLSQSDAKLKWKTGGKKYSEECKEPREFNPRGPNFLPLEPDPEAEKVDLKHQIIDERKNADEWMLDYAIQQAVTKLGPARKKKVALLVEAFETVIPTPRFGTQLRHDSVAFSHGRPIEACN